METIEICSFQADTFNVSTLPIRNGNYLPVSNLDKNAEDMFNALAISFVSTLPIRNGNVVQILLFHHNLLIEK